jgi:hypothetical protein
MALQWLTELGRVTPGMHPIEALLRTLVPWGAPDAPPGDDAGAAAAAAAEAAAVRHA